jgi:hypothetical protein
MPTRDYLQHGWRHRPLGTDPIPASQAVLPVAEYVASADLPLSSFATSAEAVALDTFTASVNPDGGSYFDVSGGTAQLSAGFYLAVGYVEFASLQDWHLDTDYLALGFGTSGGGTAMGATFFQAATDKILILSVTDILNFSVGTQTVWLSVGTSSSGISPLPANLVAAKASFCRLNGSI